jgi:hypothetical protein
MSDEFKKKWRSQNMGNTVLAKGYISFRGGGEVRLSSESRYASQMARVFVTTAIFWGEDGG